MRFWARSDQTFLVSMATDNSPRVIMRKNDVAAIASACLIGSSSFLQVTRTTVKSHMS